MGRAAPSRPGAARLPPQPHPAARPEVAPGHPGAHPRSRPGAVHRVAGCDGRRVADAAAHARPHRGIGVAAGPPRAGRRCCWPGTSPTGRRSSSAASSRASATGACSPRAAARSLRCDSSSPAWSCCPPTTRRPPSGYWTADSGRWRCQPHIEWRRHGHRSAGAGAARREHAVDPHPGGERPRPAPAARSDGPGPADDQRGSGVRSRAVARG